MTRLQRWLALLAMTLGGAGVGGCTTTTVLLGAAGVATDTSMSWEIVKHLHRKLTEGDPTPCALLDSVERALSPRCGAFVAGSLRVADMTSLRLGECALTIASRDARLWPVLPELITMGATPQGCAQSPAVAFAQANDCPDLAAATPDVRQSLAWLASADPRAVHHDVVRWLSCPNSRAVGLDRTLDRWLADGALQPGALSFSPLAALDPSALGSPFSAALEARGHGASAALGGYVGQRPSGFEEALRDSDWAALDWWFSRLPSLANDVPPQQGSQLAWLPLARVLVPSFLTYPQTRDDMVAFLISRGADPLQRLPSDSSQSVISYARALKSPLVGVLTAAANPRPALVANIATNGRALKLSGQ
jgi:hypothetical protein